MANRGYPTILSVQIMSIAGALLHAQIIVVELRYKGTIDQVCSVELTEAGDSLLLTWINPSMDK